MFWRSLGLTVQPEATLAALTQELAETLPVRCRASARERCVRFDTVCDGAELVLSPLEALQEPPSLIEL